MIMFASLKIDKCANLINCPVYHLTISLHRNSHIDLNKSIQSCIYCPFSHICLYVENDRQLNIAIYLPCCIENVCVIHNFHGAASTYAIFRHV